jgi:N-acetylmuramoyl-L-alanine amidase
MRKINEIIVHCAATREGRAFTVEDITRWHKARGFATIGYHYVIYRDGSIHKGRPLEQIGAHCVGHNKHSIGICYIGGCASDGKTPKDTSTPEQKEA